MKINKNNYEAYFLDYFEGTLQPGEVAELFVFLEAHPHLEEAFESFEQISLIPADIVFEKKEPLKKPISSFVAINESNCEHYFVAHLEGDLSESKKQELEHFLVDNPHQLSAFEQIQRTKLLPDNSIVFQNKNRLKKSVVRPLYYYVSAAAAVLVIFFLYFYTSSETAVNNKQLIGNNEKRQHLPEIQEKQQQEKIAEVTEIPVKENQNKKAPDSKANSASQAVVKKKAKKNTAPITSEDFSISSNNVVADNTAKEVIVKEEVAEKIIPELPQMLVAENKTAQQQKTIAPSVKESDYLSIKELAAVKFKKAVNPEETTDVTNEKNRKLSFWDFADAGVKGISKLTGKSWKVNKEYNETGDVSAFAVVSDKFEFSRTTGSK